MAYSKTYTVYYEEHDGTLEVTIKSSDNGYFVTVLDQDTQEFVGSTEFSSYPTHEDIEQAIEI